MAPVYDLDPKSLLISEDTAKEVGAQFAEKYQSSEPYNHICIDGFLPEEVLKGVVADLGDLPDAVSSFSSAQENLKSSYSPEKLPTFTKNLFYAFNSQPFIQFLEEMTGITGLIPDPYYVGAGIHKTQNGGHLDIHADFNVHKKMRVERRLNVLIYLNDDWKEEYGGCFEIWDKGMTKMVSRFAPLFNRMVCFSTASDTFHGNPEPVNHPDGQPRQSIALYYYTATWDDSRREHSTIFKPRPGSLDHSDRADARHLFVKDLLPPIVHRKLGNRLKKIGL